MNNPHKFDLEERTLKFGYSIIDLVRSLRKDLVNQKILDQLTRSALSIGANYREANIKPSKKEFVYRIRVCKKESKETLYWLDLLCYANKEIDIILVEKEVTELIKIFTAIENRTKI